MRDFVGYRGAASIAFGFAAMATLVDAGLPLWRTWLPGDAVDIGWLVGVGVWALIGAVRPER